MPTVYKTPKSKFYQTDIWIDGVKFSRSTKKTSEREASREADEIEKGLRADIVAEGPQKFSLRLIDVAGCYMTDIGDHHSGEGAGITRSKVALVVKFFTDKYGQNIPLTDIDHDKATKLLNWRRKHKLDTARALLDPTGEYEATSEKPIGAYTVNDTIEQLKKLFTYAKGRKAHLPNAPEFKKLYLRENKHQARPLSEAQSERLDLATITVKDGDYDPLIQFSRATGKRKTECLLRWPQVDWDAGVIHITGKRDKPMTVAITPVIRAILWPLRDHHPDWVFTYQAATTQRRKQPDGTFIKWVKGKRYPITKWSLRTHWINIRKAAGLPLTGPGRFRYHDIRHDFASNLLASIPTADGMKIVQEALGHSKITTTMDIYGHVAADKVAAAIEQQAQARLQKRHKNHRSDHRSRTLKAV
jgi:integrase